MKKTVLWLEWALLFFAIPLLIWLNWIVIPKIPALIGVTLLIGFLWYRNYGWNQLNWRAPAGFSFRPMLLRFFVVAAGMFGAVFFFEPEHFLALPRQRPEIFVMVFLLYPWLSALPQEFLYRTYYFKRYASLFNNDQILFLTNVASFSVLHLMYDNPVAVIGTAMAGWIFADTFRKTGSISLVALEHSLYGLAVFTSGLGHYFYEPFGT